MWLVLAFLLLAALTSGVLAGVLVLAVAFDMLLHMLLPASSAVQYLILFTLLVSVPAVALLAALLLDHFCSIPCRSQLFGRAAMVLALALLCSSGILLDYLEAGVLIAGRMSWPAAVALFSSIISSVFFCAGATAFCIMLVLVLCELPVCWAGNAMGVRLAISFAGLRPLGVIVVVALAFNLITGLCAAELEPTLILDKVLR